MGGMSHAKAVVRAVHGTRRASLPAWLVRRRSRRAAKRVVALSAFARARVVCAYAAVGGELDPAPLLRAARRAGKTVALPRVRGRRLEFVAVGAADVLAPGRFGIPEPPAGGRRVDPARADLLLVPGVAFTAAGERLGRGGGFYDRVLRGRRGVAVGYAHDWQVLPAVPSGAGDERLDAVVTDRRVLLAGG